MSAFQKFKSWSWSQLQTYRECPYRAKLRYIERSPEPPPGESDPRERGKLIHKAAENYVKGHVDLAPELRPFKKQFEALKTLDPITEKFRYFDSDWVPCQKEGYWLVVVSDATVIRQTASLNIDYKTGRKYGNEVKHYGQVQLYAIADRCEYPQLDTFDTELWYIDKKDIVPHGFTAKMLDDARARLDAEVHIMMSDTVHRPRPNKVTCKYCPYSPRGTGVCPVGV